MTNRAEKPVLQKRWLLSVMLATIILLAAWITYFLISFDLNDYRQQAEKKLSGIMSLPVKIGDIHYNLHDTPHIDNGRVPLPSSREAEVSTICRNLRVCVLDAVKVIPCIVFGHFRYGLDNIDHADARRGLAGLPNVHHRPAQQCCKLSEHIVS